MNRNVFEVDDFSMLLGLARFFDIAIGSLRFWIYAIITRLFHQRKRIKLIMRIREPETNKSFNFLTTVRSN